MAEADNKVETAEIGSVLRAAREASGASLDDVSALLKIRAVHLQALEEDDFDNLPGSVYAIGFIRTYANHLDLNGAELIGRYKEATILPHQEEAGYNPQTEVEPISGALKIAIGVIGAFVFYILWLIAGGAGGSNPVETAKTEAPATEKAAPASTALEKPAAKPVAPAASIAPDTQAPVKPANDTAAVLPQADPVAGAPAVQVQAIGELADNQPAANAQTITASTDAAATSADLAPLNAEIEIRAVRRTWMRIEDAQGKVLFSSIIREGEGFKFGEADSYTLATRDAGALEYRVNDQLVGSVGRRGQILTSRKLTRTAILSMTSQ